LRCMQFRRALAAFALPLLGLGAAGCANPGYDRDSTRAELERAGLSAEQAACVTEGMERTFRERRLNAHEEVTERERAEFREILADCEVDVTTDEVDSS
jgi:hypothetical protein